MSGVRVNCYFSFFFSEAYALKSENNFKGLNQVECILNNYSNSEIIYQPNISPMYKLDSKSQW